MNSRLGEFDYLFILKCYIILLLKMSELSLDFITSKLHTINNNLTYNFTLSLISIFNQRYRVRQRQRNIYNGKH